MANNVTDVPRCPACGSYMQLKREGGNVRVYECCVERVIPEVEERNPERWK